MTGQDISFDLTVFFSNFFKSISTVIYFNCKL